MLKLVSNLEILTVFALRTDENKVPVIEEVQLYESEDKYGKQIFRTLKPVESRNDLYPYDHLKDRQWLRSNCVSDCYSKGYLFYSMSDAIRRLEILVNKREDKADKEWSVIADWKVRLDYIRMENER